VAGGHPETGQRIEDLARQLYVERSIRKQDSQVTALLHASLVLGPVPHPILRLRMLVLASLRVLHRGPLQARGRWVLIWSAIPEPCTNAPQRP